MKVVAPVVLLAAAANAHMKVSTPQPQWGRSTPVAAGNVKSEVCGDSSYTKGSGYTWVWSPLHSGQCEIYQNCWTNLPASPIVMGGGAGHGGGPCKLYYCKDEITIPDCERLKLPETYDNCVALATDDDCTFKGDFLHNVLPGATTPPGAPTVPPPSGPAPTPPPTPLPPTPAPGPTELPIVFLPGSTTSKVRCGTSVSDASKKCNNACTGDFDCVKPGEFCYATNQLCPDGGNGGTPDPEPVRKFGDIPANCVSQIPYITDSFCKSVRCDDIYDYYCSKDPRAKSLTSPTLKNTHCIPLATFIGQEWVDIALDWDVYPEDLQERNPHVPTFASPLPENTLLELPGDCNEADSQASTAGRAAPHAVLFTAAVGVLMANSV